MTEHNVGGDDVFVPLRPKADPPRHTAVLELAASGDIIFNAGGVAQLRISPTGQIYRNDRLIGEDAEILAGLRAWLKGAEVV